MCPIRAGPRPGRSSSDRTVWKCETHCRTTDTGRMSRRCTTTPAGRFARRNQATTPHRIPYHGGMDETDDINRLIRQLNTGARPDDLGREEAAPADIDHSDDGDDDDLDPLRKLPGIIAVGEPRSVERLAGWLETLVERGGSDLLLVAGAPPCVRVDGKVTRLPAPPLSGEEIEEAVIPALSHG